MDEFLEPIITFKMDDLQAKAYKIGLLWLILSKRVFPDYKHSKGYPPKGDPRKCSLFQHCYKLVRETNGLIPDNEYKLYIKAQLDILKAIDLGHGRHPRIEPMCLAGDNAWVRWKIWKRKYDKLNQNTTAADIGADVVTLNEIVTDLKKTKAYLQGRFGRDYAEEHIMMAARDMERWITLGKVTPFYALLSPWGSKHIKNVDLDPARKSLTPEVEAEFKKIYDNEN